jgi:diaminopimelate epimerase
MIFYKSVSAGNDFIHIESTGINRSSKADLVKNLCERHSGAGADGVVFYKIRDDEAGVNFEIFNRDGCEAELSGNGMAGLSALLFYLRKFENRMVLHTKAGIKRHELLQRKGNAFRLIIEIGAADFSNKAFFPFLKEEKIRYDHQGIMFYPVSVGNPHVVVILEKNLSHPDIMALGAKLENAEIFPQKSNVEFVLRSGEKTGMNKSGDECPVVYYERGVGHTQSSSTGSAAVFAVLQKLRVIKDRLTIITPVGKIKIFEKEVICIENFTKIVYKGKYLNYEDLIHD